MRATDKQRGFTLLGNYGGDRHYRRILASLVVPNLMGNKEKADKQKVVSDIVVLKTPSICTTLTIITIQPQIRGLNP